MTTTTAAVLPIIAGSIGATPNAISALERATGSSEGAMQRMREIFKQFVTGDWGVTCDEDGELNNAATVDGSRILGAYLINPNGGPERIWIIADATQSDDPEQVRNEPRTVTILLPEDY
jgi:hypothetical protein